MKVNLVSRMISLLQDLHTEATADASAELEAFKTYARWCKEQAQECAQWILSALKKSPSQRVSFDWSDHQVRQKLGG